ncbi:MAG: hypothetical protein GVY28_13520 [Alphaproteobacteria bacterium]|nr:hypothetical protein [Alphaproteobacteria bacterium]
MHADHTPLFERLLAIALRHAGLIAVCIVAGILAGVAVSRAVPAQHAAEADLFVGFDRAYVYRDEVSGDAPWIPFRLDTVMNGELAILRSREVREAIVDGVGIDRLMPIANEAEAGGSIKAFVQGVLGSPATPPTEADRRDLALVALEEDLRITRALDSPVILLAYRHGDPEVATGVLQAAIDAYQQRRTSIHSGEDRLAFLEAETAAALDRVTAAERALAERRRADGVYAETVRSEIAVDRLRALEDNAGELAVSIANLSATVEGLRSLSGRELLLDISDAARTAFARRQDLVFERARLLADFDADAAPVEAIDRDIAVVDAHLGDLLEANIRQFVERQAAYREQYRALQEQIGVFEDRLARRQAEQELIASLALELDLARRNYEQMVEQRDAARRAAAMDRAQMTNIRILEAPAEQPLPVEASPALYGVLGGFFGLVAGGLVAVLITALPGIRRHRHRSPNSIEGSTDERRAA